MRMWRCAVGVAVEERKKEERSGREEIFIPIGGR